MEKIRQSWTFLAIEGRRQHGGNTGYEDTPASVYRYDSGIPNSSNVKPGDLVFVRDQDELLGVALVDRIAFSPGTKELLKCPVCGRSGFRERRNMSPVYRCFWGHTFDEPDREIREVTRYEAQYGGTYVPAFGAVSGAQLRAAAWRPNAQLSIEEVNAASLAETIVRAVPATRPIFEAYFQGMMPDSVPGKDENEFVAPLGDRRQKILATINQRRGQKKFRNSLVRRYGARCAISGCTLMEIVEAAHLWPYRG
ncbi:MAG: hypothetical protein KDA85_10770, partial [Planctomycetaceae bacterium]|nr:hypothetical protein [Planctomycetaceae bacterium]